MNSDFLNSMRKSFALVETIKTPLAFSMTAAVTQAMKYSVPSMRLHDALRNSVIGNSGFLTVQAAVNKIPFNSFQTLAESVTVTGSLAKMLNQSNFNNWHYRDTILDTINR